MMRNSYPILILLTFVGCASEPGKPSSSATTKADRLERTSEKGPVKLLVQVTPAQPRLSDLVEMDIQVTALPGVEVKPPAFGQAVGDFLVRDYSERKDSTSSPQPEESRTYRYRYQLEPLQAGRHLIRSLAIEFIDNRPNAESKGQTSLIESEPIEVQIVSELGDKLPDLADLEPMAPPRSLDSAFTWIWAMVLASILVPGGLALWLVRRRRAEVVPPKQKTPEEIAHEALAALLAEQLPARGLVKEFYLRLTGIVRRFIEETTGLRAPEQTTEEFLRDMRKREIFPADRSSRLKEFLEAADMVKYAGQQPDESQIELSIVRAKEFIDLQPTQQPAEPVSSGGH
jgi:hypothetical protein